jgi:tetratricopeptide (TPR) repeat protein
VAPYRSEDVRQAVTLARRSRPSVLWLDDVERYLGGAGLTVGMVNELLNEGGVVILATIRTAVLDAFGSRADEVGDDERESEYRRVGRQVLGKARRVFVPLHWSDKEVARAGEAAGNRKVADALAHAEEFGVAEYLAAGPQLLEDWHAARSPSSKRLRGSALVAAAVDVRRAGYTGGVTRDFLRSLHEHYLRASPGGTLLRPEPWEAALEWAVRRPYATTSMLIPQGDDLYRAFDYLVDATEAGPEPMAPLPEVWDALTCHLDDTDLPALFDVGSTAYDYGVFGAAERALRRVADKGEGELGASARAMLGLVLESSVDVGETPAAEGYAAARKEYERAAASGQPEAVAHAQMRLGVLLAKLDEREESVVWFKRARDSGHPWYGGRASRHLGYWLDWWGDVEQAREAFQHTIDHGHARQSIKAMIAMGDLLADRDPDAACAAYRQAMEAGDPELATAAALYLGILLDRTGDRREAYQAMDRAAALSDVDGEPWLIASFEFQLDDHASAGSMARLEERRVRSSQRFGRIADVGHPRVAPLALVYLGLVRLAEGEEAEARELWTRARASGHRRAGELAEELLADLPQDVVRGAAPKPDR